MSADGSTLAIVERYYPTGGPFSCKIGVYKIESGILNRIGQEIDLPDATNGAYEIKLNVDGTQMWVSEYLVDGRPSKKYSLSQNQWIIDTELLLGGPAGFGKIHFSDDLQTFISYNGEIKQFINGNWIQQGQVAISNLYGSGYDINSDGTVVAVANNQPNSNDIEIYVYQKINNSWVIVGSPLIDYDYPGQKSISIANQGLVIAFSAAEDIDLDGNYGGDERLIKVFEFTNGSWVQKGSNINLTTNNLNLYDLRVHNNGNSVSCLVHYNLNSTIDSDQAMSFSFNNGDWGNYFYNHQENFNMGGTYNILSAEVDRLAFFVAAFENQAGGLFRLIFYSIN